ncbi:MAG: DUF5320 domain-containing protein [Clostridiaceae bacterium]
MPARDGTGPMGAGSMTGRGLGGCANLSADGRYPLAGAGCQRRAGRGSMQGRGMGRGMAGLLSNAATQQEALTLQRSALQKRLDQIDDQLKNR